MEFIFHITDYDDPALDGEAAELLHQRLEARSRQVAPGMWKVTDRLNTRAAKGPGREKRLRRYRIYGVILIVLGIFALVPGLMEPRIPSLIVTGALAIIWGIWSVSLRERKTLQPPASCRKDAAKLLKFPRESNWNDFRAEARFDETGWSVKTAQGESRRDYAKLRGVFESERLWLLVCEEDMAMLLQKKDLRTGEAEEFLPYLQGKITG